MEKLCRACDTVKPLSEFYRSARHKLGVQSWCKSCHGARNRQNHQRRFTTEEQRRFKLLHRYGLTPEDYARMLESQAGVCAICLRPETSTLRGRVLPLAVDHCHETGTVRGLLCSACNKGLGAFQDDQRRLAAAIYYLGSHR